MRRIEAWLKINRLKLNASKTKVMVIRGDRKKVAENNIEIKIGDEVLQYSQKFAYFGLISASE